MQSYVAKSKGLDGCKDDIWDCTSLNFSRQLCLKLDRVEVKSEIEANQICNFVSIRWLYWLGFKTIIYTYFGIK